MLWIWRARKKRACGEKPAEKTMLVVICPYSILMSSEGEQ
jgi:hypothetical protein